MHWYEQRAKGGAAVVTVSEAVVHLATGKSHSRHIGLEDPFALGPPHRVRPAHQAPRGGRQPGAVSRRALLRRGYRG